jgi:hypothetical protein
MLYSLLLLLGAACALAWAVATYVVRATRAHNRYSWASM